LGRACFIVLSIAFSSGAQELRPVWSLRVHEFSETAVEATVEASEFKDGGSLDSQSFPLGFIPVRKESSFGRTLPSTYGEAWLEVSGDGEPLRTVHVFPALDGAALDLTNNKLVCVKLGRASKIGPFGANAQLLEVSKETVPGVACEGCLEIHPSGRFFILTTLPPLGRPNRTFIDARTGGILSVVPETNVTCVAMNAPRFATVQWKDLDHKVEGRLIVYEFPSGLVYEGEWRAAEKTMRPRGLSADGRYVYFDDRWDIHVLDLEDGSITPLPELPQSYTQTFFSEDGAYLIIQLHNKVALYSLSERKKPTLLWEVQIPGNMIFAVSVSASGAWIAVHQGDGTLSLYSRRGDLLGQVRDRGGPIGGLVFVGDRWLLEGTQFLLDGTLAAGYISTRQINLYDLAQ